MAIQCGIIGLPNVGKSTIFSALTSVGVDAENYPFCTIEPNTGVVPVADERLDVLGKINSSQKVIPTTIEFVDIAGLVKGASQGEGLGNQFLGHIRAVDALVHVVRCFIDENITHVHGKVSPKEDADVIETELMLADLASAERRIQKIAKKAKSGDKEAKEELDILEKAKKILDEGKSLRISPDAEEFKKMDFLTAKPVMFVGNVAEEHAALNIDEVSDGPVAELKELAKEQNAPMIVISGKVEAEISQLEEDEKEMFLSELGLEISGLDRLAQRGYKLLDLITFFTSGPKETRAWTCQSGTLAPGAAGKIHTDFEKGFIRAEVVAYSDYVSANGEQGAKEKGLLRVEGKGYEVVDGDVVHFRFNV